MKKIRLSLLFLIIFFILQTSSVSAATRTSPFLGLGLGWNIYNKPDVSELGSAWVYNWSVPGSSGNNPYTDFGKAFVPMVFDCNANTAVQNWINSTNYEGPVLFLNEPDNGPEAGGSQCEPGTAVTKLAEFITWKNTYKQQTGKTIDVIFGGVYFGPDMNWARVYPNNRFWLEEFYFQWKAKYSSDPDIAGIHFHLYPWYPDVAATEPLPSWLSKESLVAHMQRRWTGGQDPLYNQNLIGWKQWLENTSNKWALGTKNEIWITETGVLHERVPKTSVDYVLNQMIPYYSNQTTIKRVAWFAHAVNPSWTAFDQTALMDLNNANRTSTWTAFKTQCSTNKYCVATTSTTPTATPTISSTRTPTPSPTRTPTPTSTTSVTTITATEDAHVNRSSANTNYGNTTTLIVSASSSQPTYISYIKFNTSTIKGKVLKTAYLKLKVSNSTTMAQNVYKSQDATWTENTINYNNSRSISMSKVATIPNATSGQIISVDVKNAFGSTVTANSMTFVLDTTQSDNLKVHSTEGSTKPVLEITY